MAYVMKYKRLKDFFWKKEKIVGHKFFPEFDKMVVYYEQGGLHEIVKWSECEVKLGPDWVLDVKNNMKKESGQDVQLNTGG